MQYGHFDDANKEYVITRPDTPRSWSNYIGTTEYGGVITNNAGGYAFYRSAALGRFLRLRFNAVPMDQPGRYLYLRDRDSGDYWSSSWQPVGKPLDRYQSTCRHGTAYTTIESEYEGVRSETTYFCPLERAYEVWMVKLTNASDAPRKLSAFTYVEYASKWDTRNDLVNLQYGQYCVKMDVVEGMIRHATNDNVPPKPDEFSDEDQGRWSFLAVVGAETVGHDTDREAFIGPYRTYANPQVVEQGACTGSLAHGDNGCGTFQIDLDLAAGESREFLVVLGVGKPEIEGKQAVGEMDSPAAARAALDALKAHWHGQLGRYLCQTPDDALDHMVNVWNAYNCLITFQWSRAASLVYNGERDGLGYRDSVQDIVAASAIVPQQARERLELLITGQCENGAALSIVKPFDHTPGQMRTPELRDIRSDDCMWLFNAVAAYVKETGDEAFFDKTLPYADRGEDTVLGHLRRAIEFNFAHRGDHGLPCGLLADWNDCIEFGPKGESVFVAFQLRLALRMYDEINTRLGRRDQADWAGERLAELDAALDAFVWDGQWFRRGTREDGSIIGTVKDDEGSIFLNAQSWAVLSGYRPDRHVAAMDQVGEKLATEYGIMVCTPPFRRTDYHVVRAVLINEGQKENGGIFSHPQGWAVMAECALGRGDRALGYYRAYMPAAQNDRADIRQIEPYVHCQSTHSRFSRRFGASRIAWLSGTATWSYVAGTQHVLGVRPDWDGLRVDPCVPADWRSFTVSRRFRGKAYRIRIDNAAGVHKGVAAMTVAGQAIDGNLIPPDLGGEEVDVIVTMG